VVLELAVAVVVAAVAVVVAAVVEVNVAVAGQCPLWSPSSPQNVHHQID
jgi:hypothetical protein